MPIRKTLLHTSFATLVVAATATSPLVASADTRLSHKATIGKTEARAAALKAFPGKIMKEELEREGGGSGLRYSFDIRQGKNWREVGVDAMTGRILENTRDGANPTD
jgi:uncharacterized membrane protein YkoI